jgi:hypothetical protein
MRFITRVIAITFLISGLLTAQDIVGRWVGVADTTDEASTKRHERQTLEIKSEDGKLTGVRFNRSGNGGIPIEVQQDGAKVNLYGFLTLDGGEHLRWKLELKDGKLVGTFSAQHDNPKKWIYDRIGPMTLTKAAPQAVAPDAK